MSGRFSATIEAANKQGFVAVIPDIKCISPKDGELLRGRDPVSTAIELVQRGAPVLSVVTEEKRFGGSLELLRSIAGSAGVPVLRKDFIKAASELEITKEHGAAAVLLISAIMGRDTLRELFDKSLAIGLEPFVEVCSAEEMEFAAELGAGLIGVNNKDILTLELDDGSVSRTSKLAALAPSGAVLVSESGIFTPADVRQAAQSGANAVLVGTALWQAEDMFAKYDELRVGL